MRAFAPVLPFAFAAASPLAFLALGLGFGGVWAWAALAWMGLAAIALDLLVPMALPQAAPQAEFPGSAALLLALGLAALILPALVVLGLAHRSFGPESLALLVAAGLWLGQVAHPTAHELIHRPARLPRGLGVAIYTGLLIGHHASAHRWVHHVQVATAQDPNTAVEGQGFWHFAPRAWLGSFRAGWRAERARHSPAYAVYIVGSMVALGLARWLGGGAGLAIWLALAAHASLQILLSDYVQHYGLTRPLMANGKPTPVGPGHSWNAGHWASSALTLNATRHSDHHSHPMRPFPALTLPDAAPRLPWPLPIAATLALFPTLWRKRMAKPLAKVKS